MKELVGLRIRRRLVERLGCIKGCLEYLGSDMSFPWLYGGTGHAFIISLDPGVDVSSPDSWDFQPQYDLGRNLGYVVGGFFTFKEEAGDAYPERQREAWDFVRGNIDRGAPCFGFELVAPYTGYWIIYGYDDVGYYYSGNEHGGPLPWQKLGDLFIPMLEVRSVELCPVAPFEQIIKDGLAYAIQHADDPPGRKLWPQAKRGPAAWAYWTEALETGEAKRYDHTYNLGVWHECREMAVEFLSEVKVYLPGRCVDLCNEAATHYAHVQDTLMTLLELHPEPDEPDVSTFASSEAAALMRQAGEADARGLACLGEILAML
jgi:hypothetical protein